ncbi:MAG: hypothetical protein RLZZ451_1533 [Pseudomonadota bacterium]|jgi:predicted extracellular nuclease
MAKCFKLRAPALAAALALAAAGAWAQSIGALQGTAHRSPFAGTSVSNIAGIVTATDANGFWFQDGGDGNLLTSDAIYVFRGSGGTKPLVGQAVLVAGQVQEFRPGGVATNLTTTQINATSAFGGAFAVQSSGNPMPAAVSIGAGFLPPSVIAPPVGNVETAPGHVLQPSLYSMDFYESLEGMRVALPAAFSSGPTNGFGELALVPTAALSLPGVLQSPRGGVVIGPGQFNGTRLLIDDRLAATPQVNSGALLSNTVGVMDYSFGNYKLLVTATPTVLSNGLVPEVATIPAGRFGLASYNVENLGGDATPQRFAAIATQLAVNAGTPHLISLQEVQDNNGATNNGVVAADLTLGTLATALNAATGRQYAWVTVNPVNNADGGQTGGNIRQAFLYDTSRVSFSGVVGGALDAVTAVASPGGRIVLNLGAGRIDPANPAFTNSRKPLVTEFTVDGQQVIVIANHFNSKGGDQPLYGPTQPPVRGTEAQRLAQAQVVAGFVQGLLAINPNANIVVTGDLNDFQFADTLAPLAAAGLFNLTDTLPENERYTYAFEGNLQALDHMWVSANLLAAGPVYDIVHANAEFLDQVSDHDPVLMTLGLVPAPVPEPATWLLMAAGVAGLVMRTRRR